MVLFTKESMDADKPVPLVNLSPVSFIGSPTNQEIKDNIQGYWDPETLVAFIATVGVPIEKALPYIIINFRRVVMHLERDCEEAWIKSVG